MKNKIRVLITIGILLAIAMPTVLANDNLSVSVTIPSPPAPLSPLGYFLQTTGGSLVAVGLGAVILIFILTFMYERGQIGIEHTKDNMIILVTGLIAVLISVIALLTMMVG